MEKLAITNALRVILTPGYLGDRPVRDAPSNAKKKKTANPGVNRNVTYAANAPIFHL